MLLLRRSVTETVPQATTPSFLFCATVLLTILRSNTPDDTRIPLSSLSTITLLVTVTGCEVPPMLIPIAPLPCSGVRSFTLWATKLPSTAPPTRLSPGRILSHHVRCWKGPGWTERPSGPPGDCHSAAPGLAHVPHNRIADYGCMCVVPHNDNPATEVLRPVVSDCVAEYIERAFSELQAAAKKSGVSRKRVADDRASVHFPGEQSRRRTWSRCCSGNWSLLTTTDGGLPKTDSPPPHLRPAGRAGKHYIASDRRAWTSHPNPKSHRHPRSLALYSMSGYC